MSRCSFPSPHNILFVWAFDKYVCVLLRAYLSFCAPVCVWVCVVKCHSLLLCMQVCVDAAGFGECAGWRAMQANRFFFFLHQFLRHVGRHCCHVLFCFLTYESAWYMPVLILKGVGTAHVYVSYIAYKIVTATVSQVRMMQHYCHTIATP